MNNDPATRNRQLEAMVRALPDIAFVIDDHGRYVEVIGGTDTTLYEDGRALVGHRFRDVFPQAIAARYLAVVRRVLASGMLQRVEYDLRASDVGVIEDSRHPERRYRHQWFEGRVLPLPEYPSDRPVVLWVAFNVTRRKHMEDELRRLATTDTLTALPNRRTVLDRLQRVVQRAVIANAPAALLMMDLDGFKQINDDYGHAGGDLVLVTLARVLQDALRPTDLVGRVGGEEFLAVLPDTGGWESVEIAGRVRRRVANVVVDSARGAIRTTVSVGVTDTARSGHSVEAMLADADRALYDAKRAGRNRVSRDSRRRTQGDALEAVS